SPASGSSARPASKLRNRRKLVPVGVGGHDEGMTSPQRPPHSGQQRLVLWIAILASFVAFLDGTVVNVALPAIQAELGGGLVTQQWVVDGYLITLGALIL